MTQREQAVMEIINLAEEHPVQDEYIRSCLRERSYPMSSASFYLLMAKMTKEELVRHETKDGRRWYHPNKHEECDE